MPTGLFKYFSTDEEKLEAFTDGFVYMTPPKYFNDLLEFRLRGEHWTEELIRKEYPGASELFVSKLLADVNSPETLEKEAHELQVGLSNYIGVICLSEDPLVTLMWAHYGGAHQGFVAEFWHGDEEKTENGSIVCVSPFGEAAKVDYQPLVNLLRRDTENMEKVVLTKTIEWAYEKEWRVLRELRTGIRLPKRPGFVLARFYPQQLIGVIFGHRVSPKVKDQLEQMLKKAEFKCVRKDEIQIDPAGKLSVRHIG